MDVLKYTYRLLVIVSWQIFWTVTCTIKITNLRSVDYEAVRFEANSKKKFMYSVYEKYRTHSFF